MQLHSGTNRPSLQLLRTQGDLLGGQLDARVAALLPSIGQPGGNFGLNTGIGLGSGVGAQAQGLNLGLLPSVSQGAQQQLLGSDMLLQFPSALYSAPSELPSRKPTKSSDSRSSSAYASRHQAAEQRRRSRINERLELLRKLVPHAERANTACFLEEVIKYIETLKARTVELEGLVEAATGKPAPKARGVAGSVSAVANLSKSMSDMGDGDQQLGPLGLSSLPSGASQQPTQSGPAPPASVAGDAPSPTPQVQAQGGSNGLTLQQQNQLVAQLSGGQQDQAANAQQQLQQQHAASLSLLQMRSAHQPGAAQLRELQQLGHLSASQASLLAGAQGNGQHGGLSLSNLPHGGGLSLSGLNGGALGLGNSAGGLSLSANSLSLAQFLQQQPHLHGGHHHSQQQQQLADLQAVQLLQQQSRLQQAQLQVAAGGSGGGQAPFQPTNNKAFLTFNEDLYGSIKHELPPTSTRSLQGALPAATTTTTSLQLTSSQLPADSNTLLLAADTVVRKGLSGSPCTSEESGVPLKKRKVLML